MTILVGVDGSPESKEALRWAVAEARLRGTDLRAVHVWQYPAWLAAPQPFFGEPGSGRRQSTQRGSERSPKSGWTVWSARSRPVPMTFASSKCSSRAIPRGS